MVLNEFTNKVSRNLGLPGFMLGSSKSLYKQAYPKNYVVFNGDVHVGDTHVWYGDVDVTKSGKKLQETAVKENVDIHVFYEKDNAETQRNPAVSYLKTGEVIYSENVENKYTL
jgi:hypothetical protein